LSPSKTSWHEVGGKAAGGFVFNSTWEDSSQEIPSLLGPRQGNGKRVAVNLGFKSRAGSG